MTCDRIRFGRFHAKFNTPFDMIVDMSLTADIINMFVIGAKCNVPVHMKPGALFSQEMAESFHAENRLILRPGQTITW